MQNCSRCTETFTLFPCGLRLKSSFLLFFLRVLFNIISKSKSLTLTFAPKAAVLFALSRCCRVHPTAIRDQRQELVRRLAVYVSLPDCATLALHHMSAGEQIPGGHPRKRVHTHSTIETQSQKRHFDLPVTCVAETSRGAQTYLRTSCSITSSQFSERRVLKRLRDTMQSCNTWSKSGL